MTHRKPGRKNLFGHNDFTFDEKANNYTCHMGNILKFDGKRTMHGYLGRRYAIKDKSCLTCHRKTECLKQGARIRSIFITEVPKPKTFSRLMIEKIDTAHGRNMYSKRMGIVEPVFANIRYCKGLDHFTLRGKDKVNTQWLLYCCVHNIEKTMKALA
jgi:hypothetical protein